MASFWKYDIEAFRFPFPSKGSEPAWLNSSWCFPFSKRRKQVPPFQQHCQQLVQPSDEETLPPVWHPQISQASNMWPVLSRGRMIAGSNLTWRRSVACCRTRHTHTLPLYFHIERDTHERNTAVDLKYEYEYVWIYIYIYDIDLSIDKYSVKSFRSFMKSSFKHTSAQWILLNSCCGFHLVRLGTGNISAW